MASSHKLTGSMPTWKLLVVGLTLLVFLTRPLAGALSCRRGALSFSGSKDGGECPRLSPSSLPSAAGELSPPFSIEAWVRAGSGMGNNAGIIGRYPYWAVRVTNGGTGAFGFVSANSTGGLVTVEATSTLSTSGSNWNHIAVVVTDSDEIRFYVDGVSAGVFAAPDIDFNYSAAPGGSVVVGFDDFAVGCGYNIGVDDTEVPFKGDIADVRLFSSARSVSAINGGMHARIGGFGPGAVHLAVSMDQTEFVSVDEVSDDGGNGYDLSRFPSGSSEVDLIVGHTPSVSSATPTAGAVDVQVSGMDFTGDFLWCDGPLFCEFDRNAGGDNTNDITGTWNSATSATCGAFTPDFTSAYTMYIGDNSSRTDYFGSQAFDSVSPNNCGLGEYFDGTGCSDCPAGTYNDVNGIIGVENCKLAPAGMYCPGEGIPNVETCTFCPRGTWGNETGLATQEEACNPCPAGTSQSIPGAQSLDECVDCPAGAFAEEESTGFCELCSQNTYSTAIGATNSSVCVSCPPGLVTENAGTGSVDGCVNTPVLDGDIEEPGFFADLFADVPPEALYGSAIIAVAMVGAAVIVGRGKQQAAARQADLEARAGAVDKGDGGDAAAAANPAAAAAKAEKRKSGASGAGKGGDKAAKRLSGASGASAAKAEKRKSGASKAEKRKSGASKGAGKAARADAVKAARRLSGAKGEKRAQERLEARKSMASSGGIGSWEDGAEAGDAKKPAGDKKADRGKKAMSQASGMTRNSGASKGGRGTKGNGGTRPKRASSAGKSKSPSRSIPSKRKSGAADRSSKGSKGSRGTQGSRGSGAGGIGGGMKPIGKSSAGTGRASGGKKVSKPKPTDAKKPATDNFSTAASFLRANDDNASVHKIVVMNGKRSASPTKKGGRRQ